MYGSVPLIIPISTARVLLLGLVDDPHPALAELAEDPEPADLAGQLLGGGGRAPPAGIQRGSPGHGVVVARLVGHEATWSVMREKNRHRSVDSLRSRACAARAD
jgi:hypothetical protein